MTITYDPDNFLLSTIRSLVDYVGNTLNDPDVLVEGSFPDTSVWTKENPLRKAVVHFEQDAVETKVLGFGHPGKLVYTDLDNDDIDDQVEEHEATLYLIHYDVGIWVSAEMGGVTKRMVLQQALHNMFSPAMGKEALNKTTGGLWPESFTGGRDELDRVNDLPVWRTLDLMLVIKVFGRTKQVTPSWLPTTIDQEENLTIATDSGPEPV